MARIVTIPYLPREAFRPLHASKKRWRVVVAHRRAGKTVACVNDLIRDALTIQRTDGRFGYIAPFYRQAKAVAWDYVKRFSAPIPGISINESELRVDYPNGSRLQLFGADNADALRGMFFDAIVADEYGDWKPSVWGYVIRPALADRGGRAVIIGTPKGRNQFYEAYEMAGANDDWDRWLLRADQTGILGEAELSALQRELTDDAFRQEMLCDFDAAIPGAIFGRELWALEADGRVRTGIYDAALPVHAVFDLGFSDDTAIWFFQVARSEVRFIDCYAAHGEAISHYADVLKRRGYQYALANGKPIVWLPHDARAKSLQTGRSIEEQMVSQGFAPRIVPQLGLWDGVQAARKTLETCWFDEACRPGIETLKQYQREYDEDKRCFRDQPRHDWTSHYADSFRYACLIWKETMAPKEPEKPRYVEDLSFNQLRDLASKTRRAAMEH